MRLLRLVPVILLAASAARAEAPPTGLAQDHVLTGRIWDVAAARFVTTEALVARLAGARFILLGERHDHPEHHALQASIVRGVVATGRRPAVAFEMLGADQATALAGHLRDAPRDAAGLGDAVGWSRAGWPPWPLYQPIAEAALAAGVSIVVANLPMATARAVARGDLSALDPALVRTHGLDRPAAPAMQTAMEAEMRDSHCGQLPESVLPGMVTAQRARDAAMAERLVAAAGDGAILIAGAGHVRTDRGVPIYLTARAPGAAIASVGFLEVDAARTAPADYGERFGATRLPFDYVWFTKPADEVDHCARFRRSGAPGSAKRQDLAVGAQARKLA
jgi:uncharacterized iron-regulated protein